MRRLATLTLIAVPALLAGCDLLGMEPASAGAARREAEGKAVGAGCRHSARSVETCYEQNKRVDKAAVFAGWKDMNDYMRENKIEAMPPPPENEPVIEAKAEPAADPKHDAKPASKGAAKAGNKAGAGAEPSRH